jgi:hypothetical protein
MNIELEKVLIKQDVDGVTDEKLLGAIRRLLTLAKQKQQTVAFTDDELYDRIVESRKAIHAGKLIAQEEARKYFLDKYSFASLRLCV